MKSITTSHGTVFTILQPITKLPEHSDVYSALIHCEFSEISCYKMIHLSKLVLNDPNRIEHVFLGGDIKVSGESKNAIIQLIRNNLKEL